MLPITTPVTIVTGFLGSGKTTLINRILSEAHGQRFAVIENEFGAISVDAEFLLSENNESIIQLNNGCLCCTVRGDLARALANLVDQARAGDFMFERVLVETTGIADPGPIIQTFLAETNILAHYHLDGVVTLVDSIYGESQFEQPENRAQIGYGDRILITKQDLNDITTFDTLKSKIALMNLSAEITPVDLHSIDIHDLISLLFDTGAYYLDYIPKRELERINHHSVETTHDNLKHKEYSHINDVTSCVFHSEVPLELDRLNLFFDQLQERFGSNLWRYKGIVYALNQRPRLVVQGVQKLLQINAGIHWRPYEKKQSSLIFIGNALDCDWIKRGMYNCEASDS